jgi:hypothetical protein
MDGTEVFTLLVIIIVHCGKIFTDIKRFLCYNLGIIWGQILILYCCVACCVVCWIGYAQLVEPLCYMPEGREFDSQSGLWDFFTYLFQPHYGPRVDAASKGASLQVRAVGALVWQSCHLHVPTVWEFLAPQLSGALLGLCRPVQGQLYLYWITCNGTSV